MSEGQTSGQMQDGGELPDFDIAGFEEQLGFDDGKKNAEGFELFGIWGGPIAGVNENESGVVGLKERDQLLRLEIVGQQQ